MTRTEGPALATVPLGGRPRWGALVFKASAFRRLASSLAGVLVALACWQLVAQVLVVNPNLPAATTTLSRLWSLAGTGAFWTAVSQTLATAVVGFLLSLPIAIPIGVLTGTSRLARRAFHILIEVLKPIPPIVILPLVVLKAGSTQRMAEILIIFTVVPSLVVIVAAGVHDTDPVALDTARSFGLSTWARVRRIVLPSSLPFVITGLRISITAAVLTAVMAEIVAGAPGLGAQVNVARSAGDPVSTFAYVVALGLLGVVVTYAVSAAEHRLLRWHVSVRRAATDPIHPLTLGLVDRLRQIGATVRQSAYVRAVARGTELILDEADALVRRLSAARIYRRRAPTPGSRLRSRRVTPRDHSSPARAADWALELGVPALLLVAWWFWSAHAHSLYFPPLSRILATLRHVWLFSHFTTDAVPSLENLFAGLLLGSAVGILLGVLMAEIRQLGQMLDPVMIFFRSIPGVAYVPIMILLIGFTTPMRIASIALASLFPVLIATVDGLRGTDAMADQVSRAYRLSSWRRLLFVHLPGASPRIASGIELSIAVAVVVMVASELQGTVHGIGAQTILAQQNFDIPGMWAGIVLLALLGLFLNLLYRALRIRVLAWYYRSRGAAARV